jgi:hypothetical protein
MEFLVGHFVALLLDVENCFEYYYQFLGLCCCFLLDFLLFLVMEDFLVVVALMMSDFLLQVNHCYYFLDLLDFHYY